MTVGQTSGATAITVTNSGGAQATGITFANSNAAEFPVSGNTCGATLNAGASCSLSVAFAPGATGAASASLTFNYAGGSVLSIALSGTGVATAPPPGTGALSMVSAVAMPDQTLGASSAPRAVTLSNTGSAAVIVSSIASGNAAEFSISSSTCTTVNAGAACSFSITFTPAAVGARSSTVTVTSDGAGSPHAILVSGNGLAGGGVPPPNTITAVAVEYYHAAFDHYFITSITDEITKLDNGTFVGWTRTGRSFKVRPSPGKGLNAVCRFFSTAFGAKSSHFYTPNAPECTIVKANVAWTFEDEVFFIAYPDLDGTCPADTIPVYRMYNNGQGGAPNHRYTTDLDVRSQMLAQGWIPEGEGKIGVIMCSPQ